MHSRSPLPSSGVPPMSPTSPKVGRLMPPTVRQRSRILAAMLARFATAQRPWLAWPYKWPNVVPVAHVVDVLVPVDAETPISPNKAAGIHTFAAFAWAFMANDSLASGDSAAVNSLLALVGIHPSLWDETDRADWLVATWKVVRDPDRF